MITESTKNQLKIIQRLESLPVESIYLKIELISGNKKASTQKVLSQNNRTIKSASIRQRFLQTSLKRNSKLQTADYRRIRRPPSSMIDSLPIRMQLTMHCVLYSTLCTGCTKKPFTISNDHYSHYTGPY